MRTKLLLTIATVLLCTSSIYAQVIDTREVPETILPLEREYSVWLGGGILGLNYFGVYDFSPTVGLELRRGKFALDCNLAALRHERIDSIPTEPRDKYYYYTTKESKWVLELWLKYNFLKPESRSNLDFILGLGFTHVKFYYAEEMDFFMGTILNSKFRTQRQDLLTLPVGFSYEFAFTDHVKTGTVAMLHYCPGFVPLSINRFGGTSVIGWGLSPGASIYLKYTF